MKMDKVAGSKNDEFYTPLYAIKPIVKYLKEGATVWCPFDTEEIEYVKFINIIKKAKKIELEIIDNNNNIHEETYEN